MDKLSIYLMLVALAFRIGAPFLMADLYTLWLSVSALCWFTGFTITGYRCIPMLLAPRIDGRIH